MQNIIFAVALGDAVPEANNAWLVILSSVLGALVLAVVALIRVLFSGNAKLTKIETRMHKLDEIGTIMDNHATTLAFHAQKIAAHTVELRWLKAGRGNGGNHGSGEHHSGPEH